MSDIVERLRLWNPLLNEAADEIERLRAQAPNGELESARSLITESRKCIEQLSAENERLRKALEVIAANPTAATNHGLQNCAYSALVPKHSGPKSES